MFADLFWILFRPRQTMRRILDSGRGGRWVIPLVLLALVARSLSTTDLTEARTALGTQSMVLLFSAIIIGSALLTLIFFYGFSWLATIVGRRLLDGSGNAPDVRIALAWGLVPLVWSLLYRIPATILAQRMKIPESADVGAAVFEAIERGGCAFVIVFLVLDVIFLIWYAIVASCCVAEAHGFSTWKGLAVLALLCVAPLVIIVAAALTLSM